MQRCVRYGSRPLRVAEYRCLVTMNENSMAYCAVPMKLLSHSLTCHLAVNASSHRVGATKQSIQFFRDHDIRFRIRRLRFLARRPAMLYSMGIPPAQFAALLHDANGDLPALFRERMRRLACDFPLADNPYAQQAFARRYDTGRQSALPMYLQQQHYAAIREHRPEAVINFAALA